MDLVEPFVALVIYPTTREAQSRQPPARICRGRPCRFDGGGAHAGRAAGASASRGEGGGDDTRAGRFDRGGDLCETRVAETRRVYVERGVVKFPLNRLADLLCGVNLHRGFESPLSARFLRRDAPSHAARGRHLRARASRNARVAPHAREQLKQRPATVVIRAASGPKARRSWKGIARVVAPQA
jgi:hypothetical protein